MGLGCDAERSNATGKFDETEYEGQPGNASPTAISTASSKIATQLSRKTVSRRGPAYFFSTQGKFVLNNVSRHLDIFRGQKEMIRI